MFRVISIVTILAVVIVSDASHYYAPLGPWGLESTIVNTKAIRRETDHMNEVKTTSRKTGTDKGKVEEVKNEIVGDEFEEAEEAFFHAVENVEHAVPDAIDQEVETLFPHHKKSEDE